jgi:uncharacterized protein YfkK (UPF0435 family)
MTVQNVDEKLTFEVLQKLQQRLLRSEQRIEMVESEMLAFRELQISVLEDLHRIYRLLGRQEERLARAAAPGSSVAVVRRDDHLKQ